MTKQGEKGTTRRGFLTGCGAVAAGAAVTGGAVELAFPFGSERPVGTVGKAAPVSDVRAWYEATIDEIVRRWEPRFRHRQYRRTEEDSEDCETRESPQDELEEALLALPLLQDKATSCLVLGASEHREEMMDTEDSVNLGYGVAGAMGRDVLDHAERLGYFAKPCPEALRFPDLPALQSDDTRDDLGHAEFEVREAEWVEKYGPNVRKGTGLPEEWYVEQETRLERARAHLAALQSGAVPAFTEREKLERHLAERRAIIVGYAERLTAAGRDASWVDVEHPCYASRRVREIAADAADAA